MADMQATLGNYGGDSKTADDGCVLLLFAMLWTGWSHRAGSKYNQMWQLD